VARLHEIGKVYVPLGLLDKPRDELTGEERALLDSQFAKGSELARGAGIPDEACEWIRASGERFDGRGPRGLAGEAIPLESRIIRAACACDAVLAAPPTETTDGTPPDRVRRAIEELRGAAARELDPRVVEALTAVLERTAA
jgi:HD-GYP domain-containing protein (c-di-GMP phosphodiesterase class II)